MIALIAVAVLGVLAVGGVAVALLVAAGDDDGGGSTAVASVDAVRSATVQIVTEGSFVDPEVGEQLNAAGAGSGFLIDPSGIIVTNNHVVTGAASVKVLVGGETEPRSGRVLGVSECSDLAVVEIDGDGFPYLDWYTEAADPGLEVYAAGFPLGDPEFTLTKGIVSKAQAGGSTDWASVASVIEHDASINPGNSGGPLVTGDGRVVGVNYAGSTGTNQYFAIESGSARQVVDSLREGNDVEAIGVNGQAVYDAESGLSGIWVAAVESGSPAAAAGIQSADIITKLEGLALAVDGTMAGYCDVLRSHSAGDELSLQVLRFGTDELLTGSLNGAPLTVAQFLGSEIEAATGNPGGTATYSGAYSFVTDDSGTLEVEVPDAWVGFDGAPIEIDGRSYPSVSVAPDLAAYYSSYAVSGMSMAVFDDVPSGSEQVLLEQFAGPAARVCTPQAVEPYEDSLYSGVYQILASCEGTATATAVIAASPAGGSYTILVNIQMATDADFEALDRIIATFRVIE